jgi:hypothetical protein
MPPGGSAHVIWWLPAHPLYVVAHPFSQIRGRDDPEIGTLPNGGAGCRAFGRIVSVGGVQMGCRWGQNTLYSPTEPRLSHFFPSVGAGFSGSVVKSGSCPSFRYTQLCSIDAGLMPICNVSTGLYDFNISLHRYSHAGCRGLTKLFLPQHLQIRLASPHLWAINDGRRLRSQQQAQYKFSPLFFDILCSRRTAHQRLHQ